MTIDNLPDRPLYMHEITHLKQNSTKINNSEALFYEKDNINGVICLFLNINEKAYILGYNHHEWVNLSNFTQDDDYDTKTNSVIEWLNENYDDYGVYGMDEETSN